MEIHELSNEDMGEWWRQYVVTVQWMWITPSLGINLNMS